MDNRKLELIKLKNEVIECHPEWELKYFHNKTIDNIIYYFENVKTEEDKDWIYSSLVSYFLFCKEIDEPLDRHLSSLLYNKFLLKITQYYSDHHKFKMIANNFIYFVMFLFLFFALGFIFHFNYSFLLIPFFIYYLNHVRKIKKQRRAFGLFY